MLNRKATKALEEWKNNKTTQGLLVMGARQVGKTTTIRDFGKTHYKHVAEINFFENETAKETVSHAENSEDLLLRLSTLTRTELVPKDTLIFLDEVQECPAILTSLKFLLENNRYDVILSGSLLGLDSFPTKSLPVGYLQTLEMFPLDFEEFCWARSIPKETVQAAKEAFHEKIKVPDYIHTMLSQEFYLYLLVGGMPDAVQAFVHTNSLQKPRNTQKNIVELYSYDITKYVPQKTEKRQIELIYEMIPEQLNSENKRFKYTRLSKNARFANVETAFDWLQASGIALEVCRVTDPVFPLKASVNRSSLKLYMNDVGLLTSQLTGDADIEILNKRSSMNFGSIFENVSAQELKAHGFSLYYYNQKKMGELDFLVETKEGKVIAIEIKSGKAYKKHSAFSKLLACKNYAFKAAYVFYDGNVSEKNSVWYMPSYTIGFLCP